MNGLTLQQFNELIFTHPRFADERAKSPFRQLAMVWNCQPAPIRMSQNDVTSGLVIDLVPKPTEGL